MNQKQENILELLKNSALFSETERKEWEEDILPQASDTQLEEVENILQKEREIRKERIAFLKEKYTEVKQTIRKIRTKKRQFKEENERNEMSTEVENL
jgi:hypothetical protein